MRESIKSHLQNIYYLENTNQVLLLDKTGLVNAAQLYVNKRLEICGVESFLSFVASEQKKKQTRFKG